VTELPFHRDRAESAVGTPLTLADIEAFDDVLDARSPSEFAEDHLPGATSAPVLDDEERALVGTIYKQRSAFEAKRAGAPLAAHNIARLIEERFAGKPRGWRPLVYCWRGGGRSGSLVHVLRQVGWDAVRLDGGYKAFRREVLQAITLHSDRFGFEPEVTIKTARLGCRIYEVPIAYHGRTYDEGKKIGWKDGVAALYHMIKYRFFD